MKRLNNKKVEIKDKEQFYAIQEIALELGFSCHTPGEVRKKEAPRYMFFNFQSYGYGYEKEQFDASLFKKVDPEYILNLAETTWNDYKPAPKLVKETRRMVPTIGPHDIKVGTTAKQSLKLYNIELPNLAGYEKYLVMKEDKQNAEVTATRLWSETQFSIDDVSISLEIRFDKKDFKLSHGSLDSVTFDKDTVEQARDRVKCITAALDYAEKELKE